MCLGLSFFVTTLFTQWVKERFLVLFLCVVCCGRKHFCRARRKEEKVIANILVVVLLLSDSALHCWRDGMREHDVGKLIVFFAHNVQNGIGRTGGQETRRRRHEAHSSGAASKERDTNI